MSSHHYIQQRYQKNFFEPGETQYWYEDTVFIIDKNGNITNDVKYRGTKVCFAADNLYAISTIADKDYLEIALFNRLVEQNYYAIDYVLSGSSFSLPSRDVGFSLFRYISAQKMRTPHGLFLVGKYFAALGKKLTDDEVLAAMTDMIERMAITLSEAAIEIFDATNLSVKFILSDAPTVTYNKLLREENLLDFLLKGTQIIFPLSRNFCMVFTPRELSDGKLNKRDYCIARKNARISGSSIFDVRKLRNFRDADVEEVNSINFLIREKSYRYIAGGKKEYMTCKKSIDYSSILKPKRYRRNKEICFVRNGKLECYDEFGQQVEGVQKDKMRDFFTWANNKK